MSRLIEAVASWNADARYETSADFYINGSEANDLINGKKFIVVGRKGTGKTALAK